MKRRLKSKIVDEVLSANESYTRDFGNKANLAMPPARGFAILTCIDARMILPNWQDSRKGMPMSSAMQAGAPVMMPFAR
jgi:hypothetical protein